MPLPNEHPKDVCDTCPYHNTEIYRMDLAEKSIISINHCMKDLKKEMSDLKSAVNLDIAKVETGQLLLKQKLGNLLWPILIILGVVIAELAKAIIPAIMSIGTGAV